MVSENHQPTKEPEAKGRHHEQVQGGDLRLMIAEKGPPPQGWWSGSLDHVLGDCRLRDLYPQPQELNIDAGRPPQRVVLVHLMDQLPDPGIDPRPPARIARFPAPVGPKTGPLPAHDRGRLDDNERIKGLGTDPVQPGENQPIRRPQGQPCRCTAEGDHKLLAKNGILGLKSSPRLEEPGEEMEQELENIDHRLPACPDSLSKTIPDEVFGRDWLQKGL